LFDISYAMFENVQNDPVINDIQKRLSKLGSDFAMNPLGRPDLFVIGDSFGQLKYLIAPLIRQYIQNIPIDRIDISTPKIDATIENLVFSGSDILPDFVDMEILNNMHMDFQDVVGLGTPGATRHLLKLKLYNISPSLERVRFNYKKKTFPKLSDHGVADIAFKGKGATIKLNWIVEALTSQVPQVFIDSVTCDIDKLFVHIIGKETKHNIMDKMAVSLMRNTIKKRLQLAIEQALYNNIHSFNDQLNLFLAKKRSTTSLVGSANVLLDRIWTTAIPQKKKWSKKTKSLAKSIQKEPAREPVKFVEQGEPVKYEIRTAEPQPTTISSEPYSYLMPLGSKATGLTVPEVSPIHA